MSTKSALLLSAVIILSMAQTASAQRSRMRINDSNRFFGLFQSAGYHHRNPGPNVDYYSPYSATNTTLRATGTAPFGAAGFSSFGFVPSQPSFGSSELSQPATLSNGIQRNRSVLSPSQSGSNSRFEPAIVPNDFERSFNGGGLDASEPPSRPDGDSGTSLWRDYRREPKSARRPRPIDWFNF